MPDKDKKTLNSTELFLIQCLSELLKVNQIGPQDNLFELGLDSLVAAMLINQVREEFTVELPILKIFDVPTIDALALIVQNLQSASRGSN